MLPCERINYKYSLGKVNKKIEIDIDEIARKYNFYYDCIVGFCQTCYSYRSCVLCLFHIKDIDKVGTKEFICDRYQDQKVFKHRLQSIFSFLEKYPNDFTQILENVISE